MFSWCLSKGLGICEITSRYFELYMIYAFIFPIYRFSKINFSNLLSYPIKAPSPITDATALPRLSYFVQLPWSWAVGIPRLHIRCRTGWFASFFPTRKFATVILPNYMNIVYLRTRTRELETKVGSRLLGASTSPVSLSLMVAFSTISYTN